MKHHRGMRSLDVVILLKIAITEDSAWLMKDLSSDLGISQSEVSESLNRSRISGLVSENKRQVVSDAFLGFLEYGLRYAFPAIPGPVQKGLPTAHNAPPLVYEIVSTETYVWPVSGGPARGQIVVPLHPGVPGACMNDPRLYEVLALTEVLRLGKSIEMNQAVLELRKRIG